MHRTLSWRNCLYVYVKKNSLDQIPPCHTVILFAGYSVRKGPYKIQGTKKAMEGSWEPSFQPDWTKQLFRFLQFIQQSSAFQTHSHLLWEEEQLEGEWRKMLQTSITERPHTQMLSYLDNMSAVLQGWEHSTSASLGKDAKSVQVRH